MSKPMFGPVTPQCLTISMLEQFKISPSSFPLVELLSGSPLSGCAPLFRNIHQCVYTLSTPVFIHLSEQTVGSPSKLNYVKVSYQAQVLGSPNQPVETFTTTL